MTIPGRLLEEIFDLPDEDQDALVQELVVRRDRDNSVSADEITQAWNNEISRRVDEIASGNAALVSLEHFKHAGENVLNKHRP